eukprot:2315990-Rhodomonas_salina.1
MAWLNNVLSGASVWTVSAAIFLIAQGLFAIPVVALPSPTPNPRAPLMLRAQQQRSQTLTESEMDASLGRDGRRSRRAGVPCVWRDHCQRGAERGVELWAVHVLGRRCGAGIRVDRSKKEREDSENVSRGSSEDWRACLLWVCDAGLCSAIPCCDDV